MAMPLFRLNLFLTEILFKVQIKARFLWHFAVFKRSFLKYP